MENSIKYHEIFYVVEMQEDATPQEIFSVTIFFQRNSYPFSDNALGINEPTYKHLPDNIKRHFTRMENKVGY